MPDHELRRVAQAVVGDIDRGSKAAADAVLGRGGGPDGARTTRQRTVEHVRAAWPDPQLRQQIFQRMVPSVQGPDGRIYPARNGLQYFENVLAEAFPTGWPPPTPQTPMTGGGGFEPSEVPS